MPPATPAAHAPPTPGRWGGLFSHLANIYHLTVKELRSIRADPMMLVLVLYAFSIAVYTVATGASTEANDLTVGVVDEDHSELSRRLFDALTPPLIKRFSSVRTRSIPTWTTDIWCSFWKSRPASRPTFCLADNPPCS
jgi:ABC-2 type transport system permease protein